MKRSTIYLLSIFLAALLLGWGVVLVYRIFKASMTPSSCSCERLSLSSDQAALSLKDFFGKAILEKGGSYIYRAKVIDQNDTYSLRVSLPIVSEGEKL